MRIDAEFALFVVDIVYSAVIVIITLYQVYCCYGYIITTQHNVPRLKRTYHMCNILVVLLLVCKSIDINGSAHIIPYNILVLLSRQILNLLLYTVCVWCYYLAQSMCRQSRHTSLTQYLLILAIIFITQYIITLTCDVIAALTQFNSYIYTLHLISSVYSIFTCIVLSSTQCIYLTQLKRAMVKPNKSSHTGVLNETRISQLFVSPSHPMHHNHNTKTDQLKFISPPQSPIFTSNARQSSFSHSVPHTTQLTQAVTQLHSDDDDTNHRNTININTQISGIIIHPLSNATHNNINNTDTSPHDDVSTPLSGSGAGHCISNLSLDNDVKLNNRHRRSLSTTTSQLLGDHSKQVRASMFAPNAGLLASPRANRRLASHQYQRADIIAATPKSMTTPPFRRTASRLPMIQIATMNDQINIQQRLSKLYTYMYCTIILQILFIVFTTINIFSSIELYYLVDCGAIVSCTVNVWYSYVRSSSMQHTPIQQRRAVNTPSKLTTAVQYTQPNKIVPIPIDSINNVQSHNNTPTYEYLNNSNTITTRNTSDTAASATQVTSSTAYNDTHTDNHIYRRPQLLNEDDENNLISVTSKIQFVSISIDSASTHSNRSTGSDKRASALLHRVSECTDEDTLTSYHHVTQPHIHNNLLLTPGHHSQLYNLSTQNTPDANILQPRSVLQSPDINQNNSTDSEAQTKSLHQSSRSKQLISTQRQSYQYQNEELSADASHNTITAIQSNTNSPTTTVDMIQDGLRVTVNVKQRNNTQLPASDRSHTDNSTTTNKRYPITILRPTTLNNSVLRTSMTESSDLNDNHINLQINNSGSSADKISIYTTNISPSNLSVNNRSSIATTQRFSYTHTSTNSLLSTDRHSNTTHLKPSLVYNSNRSTKY